LAHTRRDEILADTPQGTVAALQRFAHVFAVHPVAASLAFALIGTLAGFAVLDISRRNGGRAMWWVVGVVLVGMTLAFGEDIDSHVYRVVALAEQLRAGRPNLLLINPLNGEALPTFVYYSFVPYLPAVALNIAGASAHAAFKLVMAAALVVMAFGLRRLVEYFSADARTLHEGYLVAILFLCVNYVYGLWLGRMAFAEIWVYCLIPWVILALARGALLPLASLLFLQIAGHPVVFVQALLCSFPVAWALSPGRSMALLRQGATATGIALVLAAPFWLPQLWWQTLILGPAGLPVKFADTFLSAGQLVDRRFALGLGFGLPVAIVIMVILAGARLSLQGWTLVAAFVAVLALQTTYFRPLSERLPLLATSLFVWRLMFPAAVLGVGALWVGWRPEAGHERILAGVTLLSLISMLVVLVGGMPASLFESMAPRSDQTWYRAQLAEDRVWGRREFLPNYASVPQRCDLPSGDAQRVSFAELQRGIVARATYVVVPGAPIGIVDYSIDGASAVPAACRDRAVFGPLKIGAIVKVSTDGTLAILLWLRLSCLLALAIACVAVCCWRAGVRRAATGPGNAGS
jgi:hypothetical protein